MHLKRAMKKIPWQAIKYRAEATVACGVWLLGAVFGISYAIGASDNHALGDDLRALGGFVVAIVGILAHSYLIMEAKKNGTLD